MTRRTDANPFRAGLRRYIGAVAAAVLLTAAFAHADVLVLKNGRRVEASGIWKEGSMVKCVRGGGTMSFHQSQVQEIIREEERKTLSGAEMDQFKLDRAAKGYREGTPTHKLLRAVTAKDLEKARELVRAGADPNGFIFYPPPTNHTGIYIVRPSSPTVLSVAVRNQDVDMVRMLLEGGGDVNVRKAVSGGLDAVDVWDSTHPLSIAAGKPNMKIFRMLMADNPHPVILSDALRTAAGRGRGDTEKVELILARGVPNAAIDHALKAARQGSETAELLRSGGGRNISWEMEAAVERGDLRRARALMPQAEKNDVEKAFINSCKSGNTDIALALAGQTGDQAFGRGLCNAASHGHAELMGKLMMSPGRSYDANSLLANSVYGQNAKCVEMSIRAGANVNHHSGVRGETPLIMAVRWRRHKMVKLLLRYGADVNGKDERGMTALDWAERDNLDATARVLRSAGG